MNNRVLALILAALCVAGVGGFWVARLTAPVSAPTAEAHEDGDEHGEEGEHGEAKGIVALTAEAARNAGVEVIALERGGGTETFLAGRVSYAPNARAAVGAPLSGSVLRVHVATGQRVKAGDAIATVRSSDGAALRASIDTARAAATSAQAVEARDSRLLREGVVARQDWETSRAAAAKAQADLRSARAQVGAMGSPNANGVAIIRSPIAGVITRLVVTPGAILAQGAEVAEVADASAVELTFDAPPNVVGLVGIGTPMQATRPDGEKVSGTVTAIAPGVGGASAIIRVKPTGAVPPPGSVVSGRLPGGASGALVVPSEAVQTIDGVPSIFVLSAKGFTPQPVVTGRVAGGRTEILRGLTGQERVAGRGAFLLKAELAKGEVEHDH